MVSVAWRETAVGVDTMCHCQYCVSQTVALFNDCTFRPDTALISTWDEASAKASEPLWPRNGFGLVHGRNPKGRWKMLLENQANEIYIPNGDDV